eukprot:7166141-Prymnesium_polylepis.2
MPQTRSTHTAHTERSAAIRHMLSDRLPSSHVGCATHAALTLPTSHALRTRQHVRCAAHAALTLPTSVGGARVVDVSDGVGALLEHTLHAVDDLPRRLGREGLHEGGEGPRPCEGALALLEATDFGNLGEEVEGGEAVEAHVGDEGVHEEHGVEEDIVARRVEHAIRGRPLTHHLAHQAGQYLVRDVEVPK